MKIVVAASAALLAAPSWAQGAAETATRAAIARIEQLNLTLNAVIAIDPTAIGEAKALDRRRGSRGRLHGVPILLKDNIEARGPLPTTAGSLALVENVTNRDAPLVARLRAAGAIILGKANLAEWARGRSETRFQGWSAVGGQVRNPYALNRTPCGSSSGSAVAVASGMVRIAIGTDTLGSITCPASANGIVGLRPTLGLVSRRFIVPLSLRQDTAGPMAATVRETALTLSVIAGSDPGDTATEAADRHRADYARGLSVDALRGKRLGVLRFTKSPGTEAAFEQALQLLKAGGAVLIDIEKQPPLDEPATVNDKLAGETRAQLDAYLADTALAVKTRSLASVVAFNKAHAEQELALFGQDRFELALRAPPATDPLTVQTRQRLITQATAGMERMLTDNQVVALVAPSSSPAAPLDAVAGEASPAGAGRIAAHAGCPHLTVPMGQYRGLPVGISFIGPKWSEQLLLSLGYAYEQARGPLPGPRFYRSIEESPELSPLLQPARGVRRVSPVSDR